MRVEILKRVLAGGLVAACAAVPPSSDSVIAAAESASLSVLEGSPSHPFPGGVYTLRTVVSPPQRVHVLELDLSRVRLETTPGDASAGREYRAQTVSSYAQARGLLAAVNGGYFTPFRGGSRGGEDYYPKAGDPVDVSGAAVAFGRVVSPVESAEDERVNAIVCIAGARVTIRNGQVCGVRTDHALSAGPRLLAGGVAQSFETFGARYAAERHPRTAIGLDADARRAWLVVVDGRQSGFSEGMSLSELTALFVELGAKDALNLDGGGSSTMVLGGSGPVYVVNSPIHTAMPGRERPSANHLGVRAAR